MSKPETFYPLSPLQQGLLYRGLSSPGTGEYVNQFICRLEGPLDVDAFEKAWRNVMSRHAVLRTWFVWRKVKEPIQVVSHDVELPLTRPDFRPFEANERSRRFEAVLEEERVKGFDFSRPPLMRLVLARTGENTHEFVWSFHHILLDGWSMFLVLKEAFGFYDAFSAGKRLELPVPRPYRDHIVWVRRQDRAAAERYWRETLKGFESRTPLSVDEPAERVPPKSLDSATRGIHLDPRVIDALKSTCRAHGLTLNTPFQGAWALLLSRYSGQRDVVFGSVVSGRPADLAGSDSMVGLFINTLPARVRLAPEEKILPWLAELQRLQVPLRELDYSSLSDVQGWSDVGGGESLFDSIYLFENYHKSAPIEQMCTSLRIRDVRWYESMNYPLAALAVPEDRELRIIYHASRFRDDTIDRLLGHWQGLLESFVDRSDARLGDFPILRDEERARVVVEWNDTRSAYSTDRMVTELFGLEAAKRPDSVAAVFEQHQITYRELDARSNQLARHLLRVGVGPETLVGLCLDRSLEMLVAVLGILKAGGAYVPLDPGHPQDRLARILGDSAAPVLVTSARLRPQLAVGSGVVTVCIDAAWADIARERAHGLARRANSRSLAYVMYTSGSTGAPKGVQVVNQAVVNFLESMMREPGFTRDDRLLSVTTLSFDISVLELLLPLVSGGQVVIVSRETASDGTRLAAALAQWRPSVMQATPATWRLLLESGWKGDEGLKVLCGGEALPRDLANKLASANASLWNMYGPTETTIWSCVTRIRAASTPTPVGIGHPIANTQVYVLDPNLDPLPVGVPGELYIGGDGLARGYQGRPDLTAERFIPDPFFDAAERSGSRLYRTGDLARWTADRGLEYVGRSDTQVKVRGFRIELGEVEAVLSEHAAVRQAVVVVRDDDVGEKRLVAYLVNEQGVAASVAELRAHVRSRLPEYMVPSAYVLLPSLPLTPNGKIDRRALPAPEPARADLDDGYAAPRDSLELQLAAAWESVLGVSRVGIHDGFFELGGHSLLAVRLFGEIEERLGVRLPIALLLKAGTIAELAFELRNGEHDLPWSSLVPIRSGGDRPALFLVHAEGGEVLFYRDFAYLLGEGQPVYGLRARGLDGKQEPHATFEAMAADYIQEIKGVQPSGPYYLGGHCLGGIIAFEIAQQLQRAGDDVAFLAMMGVPAPRTDRSVLRNLRDAWSAVRASPVQSLAYLAFTDVPARVRWKGQELAERFLPRARRRTNGRRQPQSGLSASLERTRRALVDCYFCYHPRPYPGGIKYFVTSERARLPHDKWEPFAEGGLEREVFPGVGTAFFRPPLLSALADRVLASLRLAQESIGARTGHASTTSSSPAPRNARREGRSASLAL